MLAANNASTNSDTETIPITNPTRQNASSVLRQFSNLFRSRQSPDNSDPEGYVEFGGLSNEPPPSQEQRTLGTFAGCFAPVSLSMFSALVFIR